MLDIKIRCIDSRGGKRWHDSNCAATRHAHFELGRVGPAYSSRHRSLMPDVNWQPDYNRSKQVNLDTLTKEEVASWAPGQTLLLNGRMLTGRDAAHKRIADAAKERNDCRLTIA